MRVDGGLVCSAVHAAVVYRSFLLTPPLLLLGCVLSATTTGIHCTALPVWSPPCPCSRLALSRPMANGSRSGQGSEGKEGGGGWHERRTPLRRARDPRPRPRGRPPPGTPSKFEGRVYVRRRPRHSPTTESSCCRWHLAWTLALFRTIGRQWPSACWPSAASSCRMLTAWP